LGLIEDIVISIVVFLVVSLRNTDGTAFQGANSNIKKSSFKKLSFSNCAHLRKKHCQDLVLY
jgi:hypothetical protein